MAEKALICGICINWRESFQVGAVLFHLIREGLLRATEFFGNGTVGNALQMFLLKLDDSIRFQIKFVQLGEKLLQQHTVSDDFFHWLTVVWQTVVYAVVAIRVRNIQRKGVVCCVIFATNVVFIAFPNVAVWVHALAVIMILMADAVGILQNAEIQSNNNK